jgi:pre-mRNA-splicing factor 18
MNDFKKKFLLMKNKTKEERSKNGNEYMPYLKYYQDNQEDDVEEEELYIKLLNKKRSDNSEDEDDKKNNNKKKEELIKSKAKKKYENKDKGINNNNDDEIINIKEGEEKNSEEKEKEEKSGNIVRKKNKYKLTIKPSYITIEKKDNSKKKVVDSSQFSNEYKSEELFNWINIVLEDWEQYIMENINNKRIKANVVSKELEKYKQCSQNIRPLLTSLQERNLNQVILDKLFKVMVFAENRDLLNANDRYIDLSIGNAAWPMGLTMVGIHQRTGKSSVAPSQVAYILNDEATKKYLQSIRRILSFLQIRYNISPSQSVYN